MTHQKTHASRLDGRPKRQAAEVFAVVFAYRGQRVPAHLLSHGAETLRTSGILVEADGMVVVAPDYNGGPMAHKPHYRRRVGEIGDEQYSHN